jgi:hypothetical protein
MIIKVPNYKKLYEHHLNESFFDDDLFADDEDEVIGDEYG